MNILKFDIKDSNLRCDMYHKEGARIKGRCSIQIDLKNTKPAYIRNILDKCVLQLPNEFGINFKKPDINTVRTWIIANINQINIRDNIPHEIEMAIRKLSNRVSFVND